MNAPAKIDRCAVERADRARWNAMVSAIMLADRKMQEGGFYERYEGLDALRAMNDWTRGEEFQALIDAIAGNLPDTTTEEDGDPYHSGGCFPAMRELLSSGRALGGR